MREDYTVKLAGEAIGRVQLCRHGLYYHVTCRCRLDGDIMYRLEASCGSRQVNLGVLIPTENGFGLDTKISVSSLGEGEMSFRLRPRHDVLGARRFIPIKPEEPFAYLTRLKEAFLEIQEGKKGISIPEEKDGRL